MTTEQILTEARKRLEASLDAGEARAIAHMVAEEVLHYTPVDMVVRGGIEQPVLLVERIRAIVARVAAGEPVQYVLGHARFCGLDFKVTPATLIPRPETEMLVDMIVDENPGADLQVLDIGTGSGCIAIALKRALKFAQVSAVDISADALAVASENARSLKAQVDFARADVAAMTWPECSLDIVVSNPPYVCRSEAAGMERHVLDHEPAAALWVPDDDPLLYYRPIARLAAAALRPGGRVYLEINRRFGGQVQQLLQQQGFGQVQVLRDQYGNHRFVKAVAAG